MIAELLQLESARFLTRFTLGRYSGASAEGVITALAAHAPPTLRRLQLHDGGGGRGLDELWPRVTGLVELVLPGRLSSLGQLVFPSLRRAEINIGNLGRNLSPLAGAHWPKLEVLHLTQVATAESLVDVLDRSDLVTLGDLAICDCERADELPPVIARSPLAPQLFKLSLARGSFSDRGVAALVGLRDAFPNLAVIDVNRTLVSPTGLDQLRRVAPEVIAHHMGPRRHPEDPDDI